MIVSILGNGFVFKSARASGFDRLHKSNAHKDSIRDAVKRKLTQTEFRNEYIGKGYRLYPESARCDLE